MATPLGGRCRQVWQWPPPKLLKRLMTGPLGVLPEGLAGATTKVVEDVDSRPLGGTASGSDNGHHRS
jgi:hypothetical protein